MQAFPATVELLRFVAWSTIIIVSVKIALRFTPLIRLSKAGVTWLADKVSFPRSWIDPSVVVYAPLRKFDFRHFAYRFKFSLFMIFLNVYTFIFTNDLVWDEIDPTVLESRGFSYLNFSQHKWFILFTSNFVHFHLLHLLANMLMLVVFTGTLELLMGSLFTAICYFISMNANVPNGIILLPMLKLLLPQLWLKTVQYIDVGASLGIIGTLGALARLLVSPIRGALMFLVTGGTLVGVFYIQNLFGLDHAFSAILGYFTASYLLRGKRRKVNRKNGSSLNASNSTEMIEKKSA